MTALAAGSSVASQVEPGVLGFAIVAGIGIALFFLMRSMNKQLAKVHADRQYFSGPPDVPARPEFPEAPGETVAPRGLHGRGAPEEMVPGGAVPGAVHGQVITGEVIARDSRSAEGPDAPRA